MKEIKLSDINTKEVDDILFKIENSFEFKFDKTELNEVKTFKEFCNIVENKIQLIDTNDCTSQQAFDKLCDAISASLNINKSAISKDTKLSGLFPRQLRRQAVKKLENNIGMHLKIIRPNFYVTYFLLAILIASVVLIFVYWKIGLACLGISILGLRISSFLANNFDLQTVGQVAHKMARENYLKSRKNPRTFNKKEIKQKIIELFSADLGISPNSLADDSIFVLKKKTQKSF